MIRDEGVYEDPENFKPERYLNDNGAMSSPLGSDAGK